MYIYISTHNAYLYHIYISYQHHISISVSYQYHIISIAYHIYIISISFIYSLYRISPFDARAPRGPSIGILHGLLSGASLVRGETLGTWEYHLENRKELVGGLEHDFFTVPLSWEYMYIYIYIIYTY